MQINRKYRFLFASALFTGNAVFFENLRDSISTRPDIESAWMPIEYHPHELIARIPPISLNWTLKGGMVARSRVRARERSGERFDAAFFNHIIPPFFLREFRRRVPSIITMDVTPCLFNSYGKWYNHPVASANNVLERVKHRLACTVYADAVYLLPWSVWVKDSLIRDYGMPEEKIVVLPPGINLQKWTGRPQRTISDDKVRVLFVGGDFERKGGDLLLQTSGRREFQKCEFHFVTRSFQGTPHKNTIVHNDVQANSETLLSLYRSADIFALPTRADLHSIAGLEAMAMGLPVISTTVGGIADMYIDGHNGLTIPVDDEGALAEALQKLVNDPELRCQLGVNARKTVEEKFNLEKNADMIVEYLKQAAGRSGRHSNGNHFIG